MRPIIRKVAIEPSVDGKSADLTIQGHLAAITAAQEAWRERLRELEQHTVEFVRKGTAGELKTVQEKGTYLTRCQAILAEKEAEWLGLPVLFGCGGRI